MSGNSMFVSEQSVEIKSAISNLFPEIKFNGDGKILKFTDTEREYDLLRHGVAILVNKDSVFRVAGADAKDYFHRISTNDINQLAEDFYTPTLFLNDKGKIIDRSILLAFESDFLLLSGSLYKQKLKSWIERYIITEDVQMNDISEEYITLDIYGPQAEGFVTLLLGDRIKELDEKKFVIENIEGIDSIIIKDYVNNYFYFKVLINSKNLVALFELVRNNHSVFDVCFAGTEAFELFRVEMGFPGYPNEINDEFNPYDVNLLEDVNFKKGCYIGQEVIARLDTYESSRRNLTGFCFDGEIPDLPMEIFNVRKEPCGVMTSAAYSKVMNEPVGIGPVKIKCLNEDLYLQDGRKIEIKPLPFKP